jgi:nicotinamidase-related amidase
MPRGRSLLLAGSLVLTTHGGAAMAQANAPANSNGTARPMVTLQMPAPPQPVAVSLKPATTALLVLDVVEFLCKDQPNCTGEMVPHIASLLAEARKAGVYIVYTLAATPNNPGVMSQLAPAPGDPVIPTYAQDKFYETDLDKLLKAKGITTLILTGWRINGSVVYTSVGATLRGYTVVVPEDASLAARDYDVAVGRYQLLTQLSSNAANEPLKAKASTLSRTDLITFQ